MSPRVLHDWFIGPLISDWLMPRDWESKYRDYLRSRVPSEYLGLIDEFMNFISDLVAKWRVEDGVNRLRHARTLRMLLSDFNSDAGDRAKLNAFYAFLVFRGAIQRRIGS